MTAQTAAVIHGMAASPKCSVSENFRINATTTAGAKITSWKLILPMAFKKNDACVRRAVTTVAIP